MQLDHEVALDLDAKFNLSKLETVTMVDTTSATNKMRRACRGFTDRTEAGTGYTCEYEVLDAGTKLRTTYTFLDIQTRQQTTECYMSTIFTQSDVDTYMTAVEGTDVLGIPIGPDPYRIKAVLRRFIKIIRHWGCVEKYVERPQHHHDLMLHCYRTTFTHFLRALPPAIFLKQNLQEFTTLLNQASGNNDVKLPPLAGTSVCLADYIDNWMLRIGVTVTGIHYDNVSLDDKIRYTSTFVRSL
jgi:hypothetical protein